MIEHVHYEWCIKILKSQTFKQNFNHFALLKATWNQLKSPLKRAPIPVTKCFTLGNKEIYLNVYIFNISARFSLIKRDISVVVKTHLPFRLTVSSIDT